MQMIETDTRRLIVAVTGASGTLYGVRLLEMLQGTGIETHLVMSRWAARTLVYETSYTPEQVHGLATVVHPLTDQGAAISSGSFLTMGMVVAPCSMRTLAAIAHGLGDNLIHRAADVVLKERRKLVLAVREAPLSEIHLRSRSTRWSTTRPPACSTSSGSTWTSAAGRAPCTRRLRTSPQRSVHGD